MDQTDQWRYHIQQHEFKQITRAHNKLLAENKKLLEETTSRCVALQENCRLDQLNTLEHTLLESYRALFKIRDRLDNENIKKGRLCTSKPQDFSVSDEIAHLKRILMLTTNDRKSIWKVKLGDNIPQRLYGDSRHMSQILMNLLENAIIHSIDGGRHKINVYYLEDEQLLEFRISNVC